MVSAVPWLKTLRPSGVSSVHIRVNRPRARPTTTLSARLTPSSPHSAGVSGREKPPTTSPTTA
jgi:hypothetical protein